MVDTAYKAWVPCARNGLLTVTHRESVVCVISNVTISNVNDAGNAIKAKLKLVKISNKYREALKRFKRWSGEERDKFFRFDEFEYDSEAVSAAEAMLRYESHGEDLPKSCSEPILLADYAQGKRIMDFQIKWWLIDTKKGYFIPEEFLVRDDFTYTEDLISAKQFKALFGYEPNLNLIKLWLESWITDKL